jgi:predicted dehydrogenase
MPIHQLTWAGSIRAISLFERQNDAWEIDDFNSTPNILAGCECCNGGGQPVVAGVACAPIHTPASERIRVGAIGVGGRVVACCWISLPESAELVALSDCNLAKAEAFKAKRNGDWPVYQDYRKILERNDIDAVIVATGEFQRVLPCIEACQAGKDVYAEKPLTLYIQEGRMLVNAVRKYGRVLQVGTQQRSMEMNRVACELVRNEGLGKAAGSSSHRLCGAEPSPKQRTFRPRTFLTGSIGMSG